MQSIPVLEECPFCGCSLMTTQEVKDADHGKSEVCPRCSAALDLKHLATSKTPMPDVITIE